MDYSEREEYVGYPGPRFWETVSLDQMGKEMSENPKGVGGSGREEAGVLYLTPPLPPVSRSESSDAKMQSPFLLHWGKWGKDSSAPAKCW